MNAIYLALLLAVVGFASTVFASSSDFRPGSNRVEFLVEGEQIVGTLRLPADFAQGDKLPVIIVAGSWTTVKEQMAATYATRLTEAGFATLTFDFRNWGESGGEPRYLEDPAKKIEDLVAAANFAQSLPLARNGQIGVLAVCASAGYAAHAINNGAPIRSLVTVAAWIHDPKSAEQIYGGAEGVAKRIADAREAVVAEAAGAITRTVPACSATDDTAAMFGPFDYYLNPVRGGIKQWPNRFAVRSWEPWLTFDGVTVAKKLTIPTLFIHGDGCALPQNVRAIASAMGEYASSLWMAGMHLDFYDQPRLVEPAVSAAASHFRWTLGEPASSERATVSSGTNVERVTEFFAALEAMDIPRFVELFAEDGVQEMPFAPGDFPKRLDGRAAIARQYGLLPTAFTGIQFPVSQVVPGADGRTVTVEYTGRIGLKSGGRYDNRYIGVFTFNDAGKIQRFTEYFDPFTLVDGFPGAAAIGAPDEQRIVNVVNAVASLADARSWEELRMLFADVVAVDYTSLTGGQPSNINADDLVAGWEKGLSVFASTDHVVSGHQVAVDGDSAECRASFIATHTRGTPDSDDRWTIGGQYIYTLTKLGGVWKVTGTTMKMEWEQGKR